MWHVGWSWSGRVNICFSGALYCRNSLQEKAHTHTHTRARTHLFPQLCLSSPRSWASPQTFWLVSWANEGGAPHSCPIRTSRRREGCWCHILFCMKTPRRCTDSSLYLKVRENKNTMTLITICVCVCVSRSLHGNMFVITPSFQFWLSVSPPAVGRLSVYVTDPETYVKEVFSWLFPNIYIYYIWLIPFIFMFQCTLPRIHFLLVLL